ncbi:hypothetical protein HPB52_015543 [Rhipicephalus sanguineus]|uniref:Uncharacterized protein n=1 Tax=Rhipicephalus sanguineus TaxID=34632 RepID=A0A9D4PH69_RHISA|nr:hypothetical protein HPB52_015543 [Rhipicephalus sanguineus]
MTLNRQVNVNNFDALMAEEKLVYPFTQGGYLGSTHGLRELFTAACKIFWSLPCDIGFAVTGTSSPEQLNKVTPPPYPLERIQVPIAMFSSQGDILADTADVTDLAYRLGSSVVFHRVVPQASFCHQDFVNGNRANDFVHNTAIELAKKYSSQNP